MERVNSVRTNELLFPARPTSRPPKPRLLSLTHAVRARKKWRHPTHYNRKLVTNCPPRALPLQQRRLAHSSVAQALSARWRHRFDLSPQTGEVLFTCDFSDVNTNLVLPIFPLSFSRSLSEQCRSSCTDNYPDIVERRHSAFSRF